MCEQFFGQLSEHFTMHIEVDTQNETVLTEKCISKLEDIWIINLYWNNNSKHSLKVGNTTPGLSGTFQLRWKQTRQQQQQKKPENIKTNKKNKTTTEIAVPTSLPQRGMKSWTSCRRKIDLPTSVKNVQKMFQSSSLYVHLLELSTFSKHLPYGSSFGSYINILRAL